jgi:hypothetical protein
MDFNALYSELNIALGDNDDFTFTSNEKSRALTEAINDQYVVSEVWDDSITYDASVWQYAIPTGITVVNELQMAMNSDDGSPERIPTDAWEVVEDNIHISSRYRNILRTGKTLYVKGLAKLDSTSTVDNVGLQEYILNLSQYNTLKLLTQKKVNRFLKNDTSMAELIGLRGQLWRDVLEYRRRVRRIYISS